MENDLHNRFLSQETHRRNERGIGAWSPGFCFLPLMAGLAVLLSFVVPGVAHASKWDVTTVWTGKTTYPDPDSSDSTKTATEDWSPDGSNVGRTYYIFSDSGTVKSEGEVAITYTWNDEGTGDPAPTSVIIMETGSASYADHINWAYGASSSSPNFSGSFTGTASCSVSGSVTTSSGPPFFYFNADVTGTCAPPASAPYEEIPAGASFTRTITLKAEATGDYATGAGFASLSVSLSASVTIHPHPYNFRLESRRDSAGNVLPNPEIDNTNGTLIFRYTWGSTNGDIKSLLGRVYEHLEYSGDGQTTTETPPYPTAPTREFFAPNPSFDSGWKVYKIGDPARFTEDNGLGAVWIPALNGEFQDGHMKKSSFMKIGGIYVMAQFQGAQEYRHQCDDPLCPDHNMRWTVAAFGNKKVVGDNGATTGVIVRSITPVSGGATAMYSVSKQGATATSAVP